MGKTVKKKHKKTKKSKYERICEFCGNENFSFDKIFRCKYCENFNEKR